MGNPEENHFQMKKTFAFCFLILVLLASTTSKKMNDENGHWHSYSGIATYLTLDINDSLTITDNYVLSGVRFEMPRLDNFGHQILPAGNYGHHTYSGTYYLNADTLIIRDSTNVQKYVRSDLSHCFISDKYMGLSVKITLEEVSDAVDYENFNERYCSHNLFVGKMGEDLSTDYFDSLRNAAPDSVYIQADDVLIGLNGGGKFFEMINYVCADRQLPINMNLHVDHEVPLDFLKKVDIMVPDSFKVHKVVLIKGRDIGLIELR